MTTTTSVSPPHHERLARRNSGDTESDGHASNASSPCPSLPDQDGRAQSTGELSDSADVELREPSSGPQRKNNSDKHQKNAEKRKRSRVTPDQLTHLERFFDEDRSPAVSKRREISEMLGMNERQTQIWFQNRRAKAKLLDGKPKGQPLEAPPDQPPELSIAHELDLYKLLHEEHSISLINCQDISIGTWRRVSTTADRHDLITYICEARRCLTWYIHSGGHGFKMEIPFTSIVTSDFTNIGPGLGVATFILSKSPTFFLEDTRMALSADELIGQRAWKPCADWTEGMQASQVLKHDLVGSAAQLAHTIRDLNMYRNRGTVNPARFPSSEDISLSRASQCLHPSPHLLSGGLPDGDVHPDPRRASTGSMPSGLTSPFGIPLVPKPAMPIGGVGLAFSAYPATSQPLQHSNIPPPSSYNYYHDNLGSEYENYAGTTNPYPLLPHLTSSFRPPENDFTSRMSSARRHSLAPPSDHMFAPNARRHSVHDMPLLATQFTNSMSVAAQGNLHFGSTDASPATMSSGLPTSFSNDFNDMEPTPIANNINPFMHDIFTAPPELFVHPLET